MAAFLYFLTTIKQVDRDSIEAAHRNAAANGLLFEGFLPPEELTEAPPEASGAHFTRNGLSSAATPG